ncbi:hypothetical protein EZV62_017301 [Acer yangbiense]|uniref:Uncharacterized protein n=1 Tax=Acer yangbiense TaxID=1000413 RepID=A0A5C7HGU3_9ROSI|nr:hypothetical protein EZV62_017301 [Acer yangbiense]
MLWSLCWSRVLLNRQPPRRKTKDSIFPGGGIAWGTTTSQTTPETRGFWSPVSSECHEGGGVASIAGDWWRRGRHPLVFWYRSTVIRAELEVGDEGEDDDRRFSVLLVSSVVVRCGGRRCHVGAVMEIVKKHDSGGLVWKRIKLTSTRKANAKKRLLRVWQNEAVLRACAEEPTSKTSGTSADGGGEKDNGSSQ